MHVVEGVRCWYGGIPSSCDDSAVVSKFCQIARPKTSDMQELTAAGGIAHHLQQSALDSAAVQVCGASGAGFCAACHCAACVPGRGCCGGTECGCWCVLVDPLTISPNSNPDPDSEAHAYLTPSCLYAPELECQVALR